MEAAISRLQAAGEQEFLRTSATALRIIQNILSRPGEEKFWRVRKASRYCTQHGVPALLGALGFELKADYYVLKETFIPFLLPMKQAIQSARRSTGSILGWDVPFSSLQFSGALGRCKYGEVFRGVMDGTEVAVKTLKPDRGQVARENFDRELDLLCNLHLDHPNLVQLRAVTLTSDPTCIVLEFLPTSLLHLLHTSDLSDKETVDISLQVARAICYLHGHNIIHCDIGARNIRLSQDRTAKVCDFGLARREEGDEGGGGGGGGGGGEGEGGGGEGGGEGNTCAITAGSEGTLPVRWMPPEVWSDQKFTKYVDVWSYGVFLYELVSSGSVPYASFSNQEVKNKVQEGYRLPQPHGCPNDLYSLMLHCWLPQATDRPPFSSVLHSHLEPLREKVAVGRVNRQSSTSEDAEGKSSTLRGSRSSKQKVKEPSYSHVVGKGGGLLRVYTALLSPFHQRTVVVCTKKTSVAEVVQIVLAKCGRSDFDYKSYALAMVSPLSTDKPAQYLNSDDRIMAVRGEAAADTMFILCVRSPGPAILEVVNSVRQNPAYSTAFETCTRGYLLTKEEGEGGGGGGGKRGEGGGKQERGGDQRRWCVLDGSTLICYSDEEDEGVKQFDRFVDLKHCSVAPLSGKKSTLVRVGTADGGQFIFAAPDKSGVLQWIEAIASSSHLDPSSLLLHASGGGVVLQAGFIDCQEFASSEVNGVAPMQPILNRRLGSSTDFTGTYSAIDYGRQWTVFKSSGILQCLVSGRPETLFSLLDAREVRVHNPKEGGDYHVEVELERSKIVLRADCPSDHFDWVVTFEQVLREKGLQGHLRGDRGKESGYVTLKRLMKGEGGRLAMEDGRKHLYVMPKCFNHMEDIYEPPQTQNSPPRDQKREPPPPSPGTYVNFVPPPPLPPRNLVPPLPPKGTPISPTALTPCQNGNSCQRLSSPDDDYIIMQPHSLPSPLLPSPFGSVPSTPIGAHPRNEVAPSQPITIPLHCSRTRSKLRRSDSDFSSTSSQNISSSLSDGHAWVTPSSLSHPSPSSPFPSTPPPPPKHSLSHGPSDPAHHLVSSPTIGSHGDATSLHQDRTCCGDGNSLPGVTRSRSNQSVKTDGPGACAGNVRPREGGTVARGDDSVGSQHAISQVGSILVSSSGAGVGCDGNQPPTDTADETELPPGWRKGFCNSKVFFTHTGSGVTTSNVEEVFRDHPTKQQTTPGGKWQVVTTEDGQVYYYNELTKKSTWDVQETFV